MALPDVPEDFADVATLPIRTLEKRYGVTNQTVIRWRREIGVTVPPGAPKGNRNALRFGSDGKRKVGADDIDEIRTCLSCTAKRCTGHCLKVH